MKATLVASAFCSRCWCWRKAAPALADAAFWLTIRPMTASPTINTICPDSGRATDRLAATAAGAPVATAAIEDIAAMSRL